MPNGIYETEVDLSTEHQYWFAMQNYVVPVLRELVEEQEHGRSPVLIDHEGMVLREGAGHFSFTVTLRSNPVKKWRLHYLLNDTRETVALAAQPADDLHMIITAEHNVDEMDKDTARRDVRDGIQQVLNTL